MIIIIICEQEKKNNEVDKRVATEKSYSRKPEPFYTGT